MSRVLTICFGMALALFGAQSALADTCQFGLPVTDTCYQLNKSNALGNQPKNTGYVQVALQQISSTEVQVTVTINPALTQDFVATGNGTNHPTFAFSLASNLATISGASIGGPSPTSCTGDNWCIQEQGTSKTTSDFGDFNYEINSNVAGGNSQQIGPLVFDVTLSTGLTISSFIKNSSGVLFTSDVLGNPGGTGLVASVPEPATPYYFAAGLIGLFLFQWRRRVAMARVR